MKGFAGIYTAIRQKRTYLCVIIGICTFNGVKTGKTEENTYILRFNLKFQ